jgi:hypothetical protein
MNSKTQQRKDWELFKKTLVTVSATMLALLIASAAFGAVGIRTRVTLSGHEARRAHKFQGMVFTIAPLEGEGDKDACLTDRKVVLFRMSHRGPVREKATWTDEFGDYNLRVAKGRQHRYFAKAPRVALADRYGNLVVCEPDISETVKL